jgi:hypothetical protein
MDGRDESQISASAFHEPRTDQLVGRDRVESLCESSTLLSTKNWAKTSHTLMKFTLLHKSTFQVFDDDAAMQEDDDLMTGVRLQGQEYTPKRFSWKAGCTRKELAMIG